jgi:hypothetical protein
MARSERAAGLVPFIIMLVLFLGAVAWGFLNYSAITNAETGFKVRVKRAEEKAEKATEEMAQLVQVLRDSVTVFGYPSEERITGSKDLGKWEGKDWSVNWAVDKRLDHGTARQNLTLWLRQMTDRFKITFEDAKFGVEGDNITLEPAGTVTRAYFTVPDKLPEDVPFAEVMALSEGAMDRMAAHLKSFEARLNDAIQQYTEARASVDEVSQQKDNEIASLRTQMQDLERTLTSQMTTVREEKDRFQDRAETAEREKADVEEAAAKAAQDFKNQIFALKQEIQRLKVKIDIERAPTPDGQVLAASAQTGIAIVNRGKKDHLKPGTIFQVYNFGKGGVKRVKGLVKVQDVFDTNAKCGIIEMDPGNPIVEGDLIENDLYNPNKVLRFYILGRLSKYGKTEATALLERLGNKVDSEITVETDYLILGVKANANDPELQDTPEYKKAKEYGLRILTERELEAFTRY